MHRFRILVLLAIATAMSTMSMDFFAPALPDATRGLGTTPDAIKLTLVLFLVGFGMGPFVWGHLADRIGRRRTLLIGIGCYILASIGCMLSPGITGFLVCRILQGIGAASGSVVSRAVLRDVYGAAGATKAIARMMLIMIWVPITAPFLGGFINSWFDWRIDFLIMALVAGFIFLGSYYWLAETKPAPVTSIKPAGNLWKHILGHPGFLRFALPNMFCFTTLLLFLSSYSYIAEEEFGFSARGNGFILAGFNTSLSAGFYLVMVAVPRIGVQGTINAGLALAVGGWSAFCVAAMVPDPGLAWLVACLAIASMGTGMVISLGNGQALAPFPHAAGKASALFLLVQSMGASVITFGASALPELGIRQLGLMLAACAFMALASSRLIPALLPKPAHE